MYWYIIRHCNLTSMWSLMAWEAKSGVPIQIAQLYLRIRRQPAIFIAEVDYERQKAKKNSAQKVIHVSDMHGIAAARTTSNTVKVD